MQWLEEILLKYLGKNGWKKKGYPWKYCLLPDQTVEGLKICGKLIPLCKWL